MLFVCKKTLNIFKLIHKTVKENFTYSFVFVVLFFVIFFNFAESTGRITSFDPEAFNFETIKAEAIQKNTVSPKNFQEKDSISFDEYGTKSSTNAKGGPEEYDYYDINTTGNDSMILGLAVLTTNASKNNREEVIEYTVSAGDTVSKIAADYGVSINTILWENGLRATSYIKEGQKLKILPITGVQHDVKKGDSVLAIAKKYKANMNDIIKFNSLPADGSLQVGETLIIPDGEKPTIYRKKIYTKRSPSYAKSTVNANKYYIFPVSGIRTQGKHGYNAVDVGAKCGTPIYAAADGKVTVAKTTKSRARLGASVFGGYGNHIRIQHPNGTLTLYAHMKSLFVTPGQTVKQGQQIGVVGGGFEYINGKLYRMQGAGRSTGCHLHFEVRGAENPLTKYWRY